MRKRAKVPDRDVKSYVSIRLNIIINIIIIIIIIIIITDTKSAFTVKEPVDGPGDTIIFTKYITNIGGHYDTSTGIFTCQYSGIYLFSLNILKDESENYRPVIFV